jgi:hypothetical protein
MPSNECQQFVSRKKDIDSASLIGLSIFSEPSEGSSTANEPIRMPRYDWISQLLLWRSENVEKTHDLRYSDEKATTPDDRDEGFEPSISRYSPTFSYYIIVFSTKSRSILCE